MFYWISLVQGEKFADRGMLTPWVGMWSANVLMLLAGLLLILFVLLDLRARKWFKPKAVISNPSRPDEEA